MLTITLTKRDGSVETFEEVGPMFLITIHGSRYDEDLGAYGPFEGTYNASQLEQLTLDGYEAPPPVPFAVPMKKVLANCAYEGAEPVEIEIPDEEAWEALRQKHLAEQAKREAKRKREKVPVDA